MHSIYRYLAHLIALLVVVQAAVAVWGVANEIKFRIENPAASAGDIPLPIGAEIHHIVGLYIIPITALVLAAVSLAMKDGRRWALLVLASAILQPALGFGGILVSEYLGLLHGINAFVLAGLAEVAAWRVGRGTHGHAEVPRAAAHVS